MPFAFHTSNDVIVTAVLITFTSSDVAHANGKHHVILLTVRQGQSCSLKATISSYGWFSVKRFNLMDWFPFHASLVRTQEVITEYLPIFRHVHLRTCRLKFLGFLRIGSAHAALPLSQSLLQWQASTTLVHSFGTIGETRLTGSHPVRMLSGKYHENLTQIYNIVTRLFSVDWTFLKRANRYKAEVLFFAVTWRIL